MRYGPIALLVAVLPFVACQNQAISEQAEPDDGAFEQTSEALGSLTVTCVPGNVYAFPGDQILMRASLRGTGSSNKDVDWSANAGTVDAEGLFIAPESTGQVQVTATAHANTTKTGTCLIDVIERPHPPATGPGSELSWNTGLGFAGPVDTDPEHYLIKKDEYVVSYNSTHKGPNWVAWQLDSTWMGGATRTRTWKSDSQLPSSVAQASDSDYDHSGYDRGHMCPSADRTRYWDQNTITFTLSNALPQAHNLNAGPWQKLESYLQDLAASGQEIFIVAGGIYDENPPTIGKKQVHVPSATWKVAVVLEHLTDRAGEVSTTTRVIAVVMPNDNDAVSLTDDWRPHRVRVDDVEALTGLDFLAEVDPAIQDTLEAEVDAD